MRVAVVGTGVSGLQTLRAVLREGHDAQAFELADDVGGVWRENYSGAGLQGDCASWQLPEFPWPEGTDMTAYPPRSQVQDYLRGYASHFDLLKHVSFSTEVKELQRSEMGTWQVTYQKAWGPSRTDEFDWVVVCTGTAHFPKLPAWTPMFKDHPGVQVMHSSEFKDPTIAANKHVIVIGAGKSAMDVAEQAAAFATQTTVLACKAHWAVPRWILNVIPINIPRYTRLVAAMREPYYTASWQHNVSWRLLRPVIALVWLILESLIGWQLGLRGDARPKRSMTADARDWDLMCSDGKVYKLIRDGRITYRIDAVVGKTPDGVMTEKGQMIKVDLIICATGFEEQDVSLLGKTEQALLDLRPDGLWLYREVLPARLPGIAFIGRNTSLSSALLSAVQSLWVAAVMSGRIALPKATDRESDVAAQRDWKRSAYSPCKRRASFLHNHLQPYLDQLLSDLGLPTRRKGNMAFELLEPIMGADYAQLFVA